MSHEIRDNGRALIETIIETLASTDTAQAQADAQTLRDYLAEMQRLAFEASFLRMQQRQADEGESDRLSLRFGNEVF